MPCDTDGDVMGRMVPLPLAVLLRDMGGLLRRPSAERVSEFPNSEEFAVNAGDFDLRSFAALRGRENVAVNPLLGMK